jgi:hypothetical protein
LPDQVEKGCAAIFEGSVPEILTIEMQQIEGDECSGGRMTDGKVRVDREDTPPGAVRRNLP